MFSAIELIGLLIGVPSFFGCLYTICLQLFTHYYALQQSDASLEKAKVAFANLRSSHNRLSQELRSCRESLPHSAYHVGSPPSFDLARIHNFIHSSLDDLEGMEEKYFHRSYLCRLFQSKRITCRCLQMEALGNRLVDCVERMRVYCALIIISNASHNLTAQRFLDDLRRTGHACEGVIQSHEANAGLSDSSTFEPFYRPIFHFKGAVCTMQNPSYVMLDFNGDTPEKRIKTQILCSGQKIPDMFVSRKVVLEGRKEAGKTCIMNDLHTLQDIRDKFTGPGRGGIYKISVGHYPNSGEIKRQMSEIVERSGGWHLRERILRENVSAGVLIMVEWFMRKDTLFLVDGLDNSPLARAFEDQLEVLSRASDSSVVVFSRRVTEKSSDEVVYVPSGSDFHAENWLLRSLEINPRRQLKKKPRAAFNRIIAQCNREKRFLGQVSVCYKQICNNRRNESGWEYLAGRLSVLMKEMRSIEVALTALLLDLMKPQIESAFPGSQSIQRLYQAVQVVRIKEWIPLHELREEWNLGLEESLTVQRILIEGRLCQITERHFGNWPVKGMEADGFWWHALRKACMPEEIVIAA